MAFTKINAAGIGTTETVTVDGLTVINDGSFGGNLTVSGVLTYEDVTNVDSVGLITARNGVVVGSGITLSKDGDIFATGITTVSGNVKVGTGITLSPDGDVFATGVTTATTFSGAFSGSGANITALNASNLASGTVPTARLGSGTASSSTFLRGDSTFAAVTSTTINNNADNRLITGSGTANTLEAEANITFDGTSLNLLDHKNIYLGTGNDLRIWHDANNSYSQIAGGSMNLYIDGLTTYMRSGDGGGSGVENAIVMNNNGSVDLYHSGTKMFETASYGANFTSNVRLGTDANSLQIGAGQDLKLYHTSNNSYIGNDTGYLYIQSDSISLAAKSAGENYLVANKDGAVLLYYDSVNTFKTVTQGIEVLGGEGNNAELFISADEGDDNNDKWKFVAFASPTGTLGLYNYTSGSWETSLLAEGNAGVQLYYDNTLKAQSTTAGFHVSGQSSATAASQSSSKAGNFDPYIFSNSANAQDTETVSIKSQKNDCLDLTRYYTAGTIVTFRFNNDFTGHIETGTTSVTYHTSSDYRLKENAVSISDGITRLKQLKPYKFNFIKEPSVVHDGFFAHEVTPVVPTAVSGEKDATETTYYDKGDELPEGKSIGDIKEENAVLPQGLDHSKLVPLLTAALQEEIAKREALEARVAALEG